MSPHSSCVLPFLPRQRTIHAQYMAGKERPFADAATEQGRPQSDFGTAGHSTPPARNVPDKNCSSVPFVWDGVGKTRRRPNRAGRSGRTAPRATGGETWNASSAGTAAMGRESPAARHALDAVGHSPTSSPANEKPASPAEEAAQRLATNAAAPGAPTAAAATAWDILKNKEKALLKQRTQNRASRDVLENKRAVRLTNQTRWKRFNFKGVLHETKMGNLHGNAFCLQCMFRKNHCP